MNLKVMEGLIGARVNMGVSMTPMRVYYEASRKGDVDTMERAAGYTGQLVQKAKDYVEKANIGMEEEAEKRKELAHVEALGENQEKNLQEEREIGESGAASSDMIESSEEDKVSSSDKRERETYVPESGAKSRKNPIIYTKNQKAIRIEQQNIKFSVYA